MAKYIGMREYTTLMLCITVFFLFADQNLLAPNLSAIAKDFGFNDHERDEKLGGYIAIGFFIVGGVVALIVGYFTDTINRTFLFGFIVIFGESAGFATFFVKNYSELFFCRVLTGISIGGANPVIFSILGDLYSGNSRIYVSTVIGISQSAGVAFGQFLAGMVGSSLGWRAPFVMIAVPAMFCGFVVLITVKEPSRGAQEKAVKMLRETKTVNAEVIYGSCQKSKDTPDGYKSSFNNVERNPLSSAQQQSGSIDVTYSNEYEVTTKDDKDQVNYSEKIECSKLARLFQTTSAVLIFVQGFPGCLPWGMIFVFLNDYLSEDRGMSVQSATGVLTCFGVGGLFGQLFGGWLGQRLYNRDVRYQCILMGTSTLVAVIPILYLINGENTASFQIFIVALIGGFIVNINGPNVRVVLQVLIFL
jgi:predicted MFS family arabinose efflux permease